MPSMSLSPLVTPPHNAHYEGAYDERMLRWRGVCARDKAANIAATLKANGAGDCPRVLEVGCGTGAVLLEVRRAGIGQTHQGIDMADPNAHPHPGVTEAGLSMSTYDGTTMPFANASFDLVYASHVLEHVPDERGFLTELARVAARWIYVEVPCEIHLRT